MNDTHIQMQETPRKHYTMLPNMVEDMDLDVYEFRLYCHLRRVAGEVGACWQSTATIAAACRMSAGKVSQAKQGLIDAGLILIEEVRTTGGINHHITIIDIWQRNLESFHTVNAFENESVHHVNANGESVHHVNAERSPGETKNNPLKKNHVEEDLREAQMPLPPDFLPDQFALSIKDIKARAFTRDEWAIVLEAERARGDATRKSLIDYAETRLSVNQHPAIQAYREEAHYYPPAEWGPRIIAAVGENGRLDLWREVVAAYVGSGWNPRNVKAMLEYFTRGEIPGTSPTGTPGTPPPRTAADVALQTNLCARLERLSEKPAWMQ